MTLVYKPKLPNLGGNCRPEMGSKGCKSGGYKCISMNTGVTDAVYHIRMCNSGWVHQAREADKARRSTGVIVL